MKKKGIFTMAIMYKCHLLFSFILLAVSSFAQQQSTAIRLFVIGNSFSQNATAFLPQLARERGKTLIIGRAELGGHSLQQHWSYVEKAEANADDPKGKPYQGKSLRMLLSDGVWDVITIQQYSYLSGDSSSYHPYAEKLIAYIKKLQPNAEIVIHQTWAYRADAKKFGRIDREEHLAKDQQEMWQKSRAAYHQLASRFSLRLLPVGDAFQVVANSKRYGYRKDTNFDFDHPVAPALPNQEYSINAGYSWNKNELSFDPNHANEAGKYLGGLIWYSMLFKESPKVIAFKPVGVSEAFAKYLRGVAAQVVKQTVHLK